MQSIDFTHINPKNNYQTDSQHQIMATLIHDKPFFEKVFAGNYNIALKINLTF